MALDALSLCQAPWDAGLRAAATWLASLQPAVVGNQKGRWAAEAPPAPLGARPPGDERSMVQKSACVAGSIQQWAATCCRSRRARGLSCSRPRIRSWHSVGKGSRLWPPTAHSLARAQDCQQCGAVWRRRPVQSPERAEGVRAMEAPRGKVACPGPVQSSEPPGTAAFQTRRLSLRHLQPRCPLTSVLPSMYQPGQGGGMPARPRCPRHSPHWA